VLDPHAEKQTCSSVTTEGSTTSIEGSSKRPDMGLVKTGEFKAEVAIRHRDFGKAFLSAATRVSATQ
jgi:lipase chaperone LimK